MYIAFDIGGTNIKYAIVDAEGNINNQGLMPTNSHLGPDNIMDRIVIKAQELSKNQSIDGIAISTAGQVDSDKGEITYAGETMPGYTGYKIKEVLENRLPYKVQVENDVNCALLGELWQGAANNKKNVVMLTIGTGIGGAIAIDGKLYKGSRGSAGEVGYMPMGNKIFEQISAVSYLIKKVEKVTGLRDLTGKEVFELAKVNNDVKDEIDIFYDTLANGISTIACILDPEVIILGGAISKRNDFIVNIEEKLIKYMPNHLKDKKIILAASLGNDAGILGAVCNYRSKNKL